MAEVGVELEPSFDLAAFASEEAKGEEEREPVYTRTLAELYLRQGVLDQALEVYRHLLEASPDDAVLRERVAALEAGESIPAPTRRDDEEIEVLARDLAESGAEGHEVESPFAWADEVEAGMVTEESVGGERISAYFDRLLEWDTRELS